MKINLKVDPYSYPVIIIAAFVLGMVLAIALGFRPSYGSHGKGRGHEAPALIHSVAAQDFGIA